jgi:ABC-type transporter Mla MlaB component
LLTETRENGGQRLPTLVVMIGGPIAPSEVSGLCERVREVLENSDADLVLCDVSAVVRPDVGTVDALARLQLTARRLGREVRLRRACVELRELVALMGLSDVVPIVAGLPLEPRGQAEERKKPVGVEEEADPGDPAV